MTSLLQDVRYAIRAMRRNRGASLVAVLSLAVGIGPNAAVFSALDAIGLRPLAIREPGGLLRLHTEDANHRRSETSYPDYTDLRSAATQLSGVSAWGFSAAGVSGGDRAPEIVLIAAVSDGFFPLLGVTAAAGRLFRQDETMEGAAGPVVLISDVYWKRRYDRSPAAIDSTIRLNTTDYRVVGVLPASFRGIDQFFNPDVWVPFGAEPDTPRSRMPRDRRTLHVVARLREGATLEQAQAQLDALSNHLAQAYPKSNANRRFVVEREETGRRAWIAPVAIALLVIPCLVLLIACANVAGLLMGRAGARRAEIAVRVALGASRWRLIRQFLTESAILAVVAGAGGLLVGHWVISMLPALLPALPVQLGLEFRLDARVLLFTLAVTAVTVPIFGLAPALFSSKPRVAAGRSRRLTFRNVLTVGQIAGSLVLLTLSGLLVRSFINSADIDPGFVKRPMILSTVAPASIGYDQQRSAAFLRQLVERLSARPSVESATVARHMPLNNLFGGGATQGVRVPGVESQDGRPLRVPFNTVDEHYFTTMGTRIVRGRAFTAADRWPGTGVVLVNETMAKRFWPGEDAVGRWIELADRPQPERRRCLVVGVVQDAKYLRLTEDPAPYLYIPFEQQPPVEATVIVRTRGREANAMEDFRREVRALDPSMPAMEIVTLDEHMRLALLFERLAAMLVGALGALALLLSVVGLYGVIAYLAALRTREIGIRMALGARPADVLRQIVAEGSGFAAAGIAIGVALGVLAARSLASVLYGVSSYDPATYAITCAIVMTVAVAAAYFPARRAARVDPVQALRAE